MQIELSVPPPPVPVFKVGLGGTSGGARFLVAHTRPLQLQQHGVQRLDGASLRPARPERYCQRADNLIHLDVDMRGMYALASHVQRLLPGRHIIGPNRV